MGPSGFEFQGNCNDGSGALTQAVTTVAGAQYTLTANVTDWSGNPSNVVRLSLGDAAPVTCTLTNTYTPCTGTFTAPTSAELLRVSFQTVDGSGMVYIDDIAMALLALPPSPQASPVPTTSSVQLIFALA